MLCANCCFEIENCFGAIRMFEKTRFLWFRMENVFCAQPIGAICMVVCLFGHFDSMTVVCHKHSKFKIGIFLL